MWANRITLDYIKHDNARLSIKRKLDEIGLTDECINMLTIHTDAGYVYYVVTLSDKTQIKVFDDGIIFN